MRVVVDASAILSVLFNEPAKSAIIENTKGADLVSPASLAWEVGNAISANVKRKRITPEQAKEAIRDYALIDIRLVDINIEEAIVISNKFNIYAYDAYILCCAVVLNSPLLCVDKHMLELAKAIGVRTIEV